MAPQELKLPRSIGDGLVLRRGTADDVEAVAQFNKTCLTGDEAPPAIGEALAEWTRDLLGGTHPAVGPSDCTVVEDAREKRIVSSIILIPQTWTYDGIPFLVGRPELVATHPDYRHRGLVRAQIEVMHQWSAERGHLVQAITGIPWFYRQFGYEMCVDLDCGRYSYRRNIAVLKTDETEPFRLRPATDQDLERIARLYADGTRRSLVAAVRDRSVWEYELSGRRDGSMPRMAFKIVETAAGEAAGFVAIGEYIYRGMLPVAAFELEPRIPWQRATPSVLRALMADADVCAAKRGEAAPEGLRLYLDKPHPAFETVPTAFPEPFGGYAFYMRVPDLPAFLTRIQGVLNKRLAESPFSGQSGEVKLNFYRSGLMMRIDDGRISDVQCWQPPNCHSGDAQYPDLTFLSVLFGHRTTKELNATRADCFAIPSSEPLLNTLFPRRESCVWPVG